MPEPRDAPQRKPDPTDYRQRSRVNRIAFIGVCLLIALGWYAAKIFVEHEKLGACIASGRKTCVDLNLPPRQGVFVPAH